MTPKFYDAAETCAAGEFHIAAAEIRYGSGFQGKKKKYKKFVKIRFF